MNVLWKCTATSPSLLDSDSFEHALAHVNVCAFFCFFFVPLFFLLEFELPPSRSRACYVDNECPFVTDFYE
jgi:hypothetical protein